jgi:F1F0 ATPase subunit 2
MNESIYLSVGVMLWGIALGLVYFGGLWITVSRLPRMKRQTLWMLGSFILRNVLVAAGFYAIVTLGWQSVLLCLPGLLGVRFVMIRRINKSLEKGPVG